jgi:hypothetical protein
MGLDRFRTEMQVRGNRAVGLNHLNASVETVPVETKTAFNFLRTWVDGVLHVDDERSFRRDSEGGHRLHDRWVCRVAPHADQSRSMACRATVRLANLLSIRWGMLCVASADQPKEATNVRRPTQAARPMINHVFDAMVESPTKVREVVIAGPGNVNAAFETSIKTRHVDLAKGVVGAPL